MLHTVVTVLRFPADEAEISADNNYKTEVVIF